MGGSAVFELRKVSREDVPALVGMCNAVDARYLDDRLPQPCSEKDAEEWVSHVMSREGVAGVFRNIWVDGALAGSVSVERGKGLSCRDAEICYMLVGACQGRGIATDAVGRMCRLAFDELSITRISAWVFEPNAASVRVLEKNGFMREGLVRNSIFKDGTVYNACVMGLLREELQPVALR